nr:hypothetical protein [Tanacetum cinerariifolium]
MALHIDGQSIDVDAPPDIIDVVDEDDDNINEEDPIPYDFADSDDEDLVNLDIDDGINMSADVARGHDGDVGGDDHPPPYQGTQKPNLGGTRAGRLHTRQETRNLELKAITDKSGPVPIRFEVDDRETLMPLGDHHLQNIYNGKKAALKERYWVPEEDGTYDLERIRRGRPPHISEGSRSIAALRDMHMETSATREYPSLIHTFFLTHTVGDVFLNPEDKALYDEMLRLQGLGSNTPTGVPYTEDEILTIVRGGKQRGHIFDVGWVLPEQSTVIPPPSQSTHFADIAKLKKSEKRLTKQVNMFTRLFGSDDKFSQMLRQLESQPEYGGGSGSGECGDDEPRDDKDEDEEDEDDS